MIKKVLSLLFYFNGSLLSIAIFNSSRPVCRYLSVLANVNKKSLSRYELGASIPPADALKAIADAQGVSSDYLLSEEHVIIKDKELVRIKS